MFGAAASRDSAVRGASKPSSAGRREEEVLELERALAASRNAALRPDLLLRLCRAQQALSRAPTGCERLQKEFPSSPEAREAQRLQAERTDGSQ